MKKREDLGMKCPYYNNIGFKTCKHYVAKNKQIASCKYFECAKCYKDSSKPMTPNKSRRLK